MDKTENFINKAKMVHGDYYDYSKVKYVNSHTKITIICPEHGEFTVLPYNHINGHKCPYCGLGKKRTEDFIKEAKSIHGDKYDYSETEYKSANSKVLVRCKKHGLFSIRASSHLDGCGCKKCAMEALADSQKKTTEEFIKQAKLVHGDRYDYSKTKYVNASTKVCITCHKHGDFWQTPIAHCALRQGCPKCKNSKMEEFIENFLESEGILYEKEKTFDWLKYECNMRIDYYLPLQKVAIECQGGQHFCSVKRFGGDNGLILRKNRDNKKNKLCQENGIKMIYIVPKRYKSKIDESLYNEENTIIFEPINEKNLVSEIIEKISKKLL